MDMTQIIPGMDITYGELLDAYHAADAETQKEIRQLLGMEE